MGVYKLSNSGSLRSGRTLYTSMEAGNQFGAMVPIATATLASPGEFFFGNIPQNFQDLFMVVNGRSTLVSGSRGGYFAGFNGNYGGNSNYSSTTLRGNGSALSASRLSNQQGIWDDGDIPAAQSAAGIFGAMSMHILNYKNASTFKTYLMRSAADTNGSGFSTLTTGTWRSTAAINSIFLTCSTQFAAGSTATLYGIRASNS
jgi:hypothetical protein